VAGNRVAGNWLVRHPFFAPALIALLVAAPAVQNKSVDWDDPKFLGDGSPVHLGLTWRGIEFAFTSIASGSWLPLTWLSLEFDVGLFGTGLAGHHFVSVLLHGLTAGLFALLLRRLGASPYIAMAGSALWALHPLRVESFAWIAERKDALFAFFMVGALLLYTRYAERPSFRRFLSWLACAFLAFMSKPTAMVLPVILILLDWWPLDRIRFFQQQLPLSVESPAPLSRNRWLPFIDKVPVAIASVALLFVTVAGQRRDGAFSVLAGLPFAMRLSNAVVGYTRYLGMMLWPVQLACFYPYPKSIPLIKVALSAILLAALTSVAVYQARRRPWLLMGWLWFLLTLVPNSGLAQVGAQSIADRYTEIPMMGLVIALIWTVSESLTRRPQLQQPVVWIGVASLLVLSLLTLRQIGYWHDTETLFRHSIAVEDSAIPRYNLAIALEDDERYPEAEAQYKAAIALDPNHFENFSRYAELLMKMRRFDEAVAEAQAGTKVSPDNPKAATILAQAVLHKGEPQAALTYYDRAIALGSNPAVAAAYLSDYAASLAGKERFGDAELLIRKAVQLDPTLLEARRNLVLVLLSQHRSGEARAALDEAIRQTGRQRIYDGLDSQVAPR
jgi:protein O-mannosyl-transferase